MGWLFALLLVFPAADDSESARELRTYDIRFLTEAVPQFPAEIWPSAGGPEMVGAEYEDESAVISFSSEEDDEDYSIAWTPEGQGIPAERLVELIQRNIAEDSWANERNSIEASAAELVVVQKPAVHAQIEALLKSLRTRRATMVAVDVAVVPTAALPTRTGLSPWLTPAEFKEAGKKAGAQGMRISLTAYNEQRVSGFRGRYVARLRDVEINQTGVLPVANPVVEKLPVGVSVEVMPISIPGTDLFRLEVRLVRLDEAGKSIVKPTFFGDLVFRPLKESSLSTSVLVTKERPTLVGRFRAFGLDGRKRDFSALVRVRPVDVVDVAEAQAETAEEFSLRVHDVRFLTQSAGSGEAPLPAELLGELIRHNVDPNAWRDERAAVEVDEDGGSLNVVARLETHRRVQNSLQQLLEEHARVVTVEVREYVGRREPLREMAGAATGSALLPEGASSIAVPEGVKLSYQGTTVGLLRESCQARGYMARPYLSDVEAVSGGTGFAILEMPDPVTSTAGSGFTLSTKVEPLHHAGRVLLDLELRRFHTEFERTVRVQYRGEIGPLGGSGKVDANGQPAPARARVPLPFDIDLPEQERHATEVVVSLPIDRPAILELDDTGDGEGRLVIATVRVHGLLEEGR